MKLSIVAAVLVGIALPTFAIPASLNIERQSEECTPAGDVSEFIKYACQTSVGRLNSYSQKCTLQRVCCDGHFCDIGDRKSRPVCRSMCSPFVMFDIPC
jgi:hypothetical protein